MNACVCLAKWLTVWTFGLLLKFHRRLSWTRAKPDCGVKVTRKAILSLSIFGEEFESLLICSRCGSCSLSYNNFTVPGT